MLIIDRASRKPVHRPLPRAAVIATGILLAAAAGSAQTAPVAQNDSYFVSPSGVLYVAPPGILSNDSDADGNPLTAVLVSGPSSGSLSFNADGSFTYTAAGSFVSTDTFTYQASDDEAPPRLSNVATVTLLASPGIAALKTGCVNESNNLLNNCTANDLTFVQLGLGTQRDGCVNSSDRVRIFLRGAVQNTTAQARYDVGLWFPRPEPEGSDPGTIDPNGDGALSGLCYLAGLMNPEPVTPTDACVWDPGGALDLASGSGPWVNAESAGNNDSCADVYSNSSSTVCDVDPADGSWDDSIVLIDLDPQGIEIDCNDDDGTGVLDGFVNMPVCLTWGNQQGQVDNDGNGLCDGMAELQPGTKSKCRCEQYQATDIPAPELSISCPQTPTRVDNIATMDFSYTNSCTCSPDLATAERFRCCTASIVEFVIGFDPAEGTVSNATAGGTFASVSWDNTAGTITWRPGFSSTGDGIIPQSGKDTLTVTYVMSGSTLTPFPITTNWANSISGGALVSPVSQTSLGGTCNVQFNSTWASVAGLTADVRDGRTVVSWQTLAEVGSVGFDVYRSNGAGGDWVKINDSLVPALGDGPGGRYQYVDRDAPVDGVVTYKVREIDAWGDFLDTRPVTVALRELPQRAPSEISTREARKPSARVLANVRGSARKGARTGAAYVPGGPQMQPDRPRLAKIGVTETGIHRVSATEIASALETPEPKILTRIAQHRLAISTGGQPVAWMADGAGSGLLFYGQAPDSLYNSERIYMLMEGEGLEIERADAAAPPPAPAIGTFTETATFEEDLLMRPFDVVEEGRDFWFWDFVIADHPVYGESSIELELADVSDTEGDARLGVGIVGFAPRPGLTRIQASVFVNDAYVGDLDGPVVADSEVEFEFSQAHLNSGANVIRIVGREGGLFIDRFVLTYDRGLHAAENRLTVHGVGREVISIDRFSDFSIEVFDVSDPLRPSLVPANRTLSADGQSVVASFQQPTPGGTYLAAGSGTIVSAASVAGRPKADLRGNWSGADYVIITTSDFAGAAQRLADHRRGEGLKSLVVDIDDIFDDFADGERNPSAVQDFLRHATDNWVVAPRYVLLAGRGNYDYKDLEGYGGNLLPPMLAATARGLIPSDNLTADLDGNRLPDLAIGRLPVLTVTELEAVIDKIITYEEQASGDWAKRVLLVADDPDHAGDFAFSASAIASAVPDDRVVDSFVLWEPYSPAGINRILVDRLEDGIEIINWIGHSGITSLEEGEVLNISHLEQLEGTPHPTVFVGLTCLINNFGIQWFAALGEELAVLPDGGAIAVWAAAGLSKNSNAEALGKQFMAELDEEEPRRLGDIIDRAIENYEGRNSDIEMINEYVLFGDPALRMK